MSLWWERRAASIFREMVRKAMEDAGCSVPGLYLAKNLGLNMTDDYWLRPDGSGLEYKHVKGSGAVKPPYDPNVSLGGQMGKYWILAPDRPILVKEARRHHGQQAVNEAFAVWIHERQGTNAPFVRYHGTMMGGGWAACRCGTFALENVEFVPAYEILESWKGQNSLSPYENYIKACIQYGIERSMIQDFMDYQTMTDFVISNMDRHLANFGVLRGADTMRLIGPAPIFDSGDSMFFGEERETAYSRAGLLEQESPVSTKPRRGC